jgi:large subunit ribosomal protein L10
MAKTKKEKVVLKNEYQKRLKASKGLIVLKPSKLTPNEVNEFRKEISKFESNFTIVKNSIMKIALKEEKLPEVASLDFGEHAFLYLAEDIISPSKALKKFIDSTKNKEGVVKLEIIAGILEGALLDKVQVNDLAEMPDKRGSVAMILGILDQAISGVLNVLEDAPRGIVSVLDQAFKE